MMTNGDTFAFSPSPQIPNGVYCLRIGTLTIQENKKEYHHRTEKLEEVL